MKIFQNTKSFETCSIFLYIYLRSFVVRVTLIATVFTFVITTLNDRVFRNYNNFYFLCLHRLLHLMLCRTATNFFHVCLSSANQVTFIDPKDRCMVLISFSISLFFTLLFVSPFLPCGLECSDVLVADYWIIPAHVIYPSSLASGNDDANVHLIKSDVVITYIGYVI